MKRLMVIMVATTMSLSAIGAHVNFSSANQSLNTIKRKIINLNGLASQIRGPKRKVVAQRLKNLTSQMKHLSKKFSRGRQGDGFFGRWISAPGQNCYTACAIRGKSLTLSRDGAHCVSGEQRAGSAAGKVPFVYGCWPNCSPQSQPSAVSVGNYCYGGGQKRDYDQTDITVGCFCK